MIGKADNLSDSDNANGDNLHVDSVVFSPVQTADNSPQRTTDVRGRGERSAAIRARKKKISGMDTSSICPAEVTPFLLLGVSRCARGYR